MVVIFPEPTQLIAAVVFVLWRIFVWRKRGGDPLREAAVAALFIWIMVIVQLTFFPLIIIFYDWASGVNLVPFASISQFLNDGFPAIGFRNIVGNIILFVPLGILLPLLSTRLRSFGSLLWRGMLISAGIEVLQLATRARALDIDDVILNTLGMAIGWGIFKVAAAAIRRTPKGELVLNRLGEHIDREPLLLPIIPVALTLLFVIPMLGSIVVSGTLNKSELAAIATEGWADGNLVAQTDIDRNVFLVATSGPTDDGASRLVGSERVLPGRYTWTLTSDMGSGSGSRFSWGITAFNVVRGENPVVYVWGSNLAGATSLVVSGNGVEEQLAITQGDYFIVGFETDGDSLLAGDTLEDFQFTFLDESGGDISSEFALENR